MKKLSLCIVLAGSALLAACQKDSEPAETEVTLDTPEKKVSYTIGLSVAENIRIQKFDFDSAAFLKAVEDVKAGNESQLSDEEMRATMQSFQSMQRELMQQEREEQQTKNREEGAAFLAEKEQEEGVVKTESGLLYKVITEGSGETPKASDTIVAHYSGKLLDGSEFDSSYKRGAPATFGVSNLIPGWVEALQLMPVGSKWELYIPSELAYGERGNQGIPPSATLIFEMELIEIVDKTKDAEEEKPAE